MKHGADVNYVNSLGNSVLMVALSANHGTPIIAILRCLVAAGADLSKTGGRLISVIWQAARIVGNKNLEYDSYYMSHTESSVLLPMTTIGLTLGP